MVKDVKDLHVDRRRILLNTPHIKEASGAIANFKTDVTANLKKCVVEIEPVQDLHGYDHPWPDGGNVNKITVNRTEGLLSEYAADSKRTFEYDKYYVGLSYNNYYQKNTIAEYSVGNNAVSLTTPRNAYRIAFPISVSPNTTYYVGATYNGTVGIAVSYYDAEGSLITYNTVNTPRTITTPEGCITCVVVVYDKNASNQSVAVSDVFFNNPSSETAYTPYSNICPITGWTEMEVWKGGKNIYDNSTYETFNLLKDGIALRYGHSFSSGVYTIFNAENVSRFYRIVSKDLSDLGISITILPNSSVTVFVPEDKILWVFYTNTNVENVCVSIGTEATDYEPYNATIIPITFPSEAGIVYGGTLDLLSGELIVDRAIVDLGTLNWNALSDVEMRARVPEYTRENSGWSESYTRITSNALVVEDPDIVFVKRKAYDFTNKSQNYYNFDCKIPENTFADANAFKTWLNDIDGNGTHAVVSIPTATPITYQLTPQTLKSIRGVNNIWSDAGDTAVKYWGH